MSTPNFGLYRTRGENLGGDGSFDPESKAYNEAIGHTGLNIDQVYV